MLEISEFVLRQDYTILTTKTKGTNRFKGLCTRRDRSIYNLPTEELMILANLPNINEILENGGVMVSTKSGFSFRTTIGYMDDDHDLADINSLELQETAEAPNYCRCLIELDGKLDEKRWGQDKTTQAPPQYTKTNKGEK